MTQQALMPINQGPSAVQVAKPQPTVADMLQAVVERGVTAENVSAVKEIVGLYERMQDREAEKSFAGAFVALQSELSAVKAMKPVLNRDGTTRYTYAPYEEIMEQVRPLLQKHGFTVEFSTDYAEGRLIKTCTLQHTGGHKRSNKFAVRIGSGPPSASECQADGAASTYAKRFALCDALNITIDKDSDARAEGGKVTQEQAAELERRVSETNSDRGAFLKLAGAATYTEIPAAKYDVLDQLLRRKEARGK